MTPGPRRLGNVFYLNVLAIHIAVNGKFLAVFGLVVRVYPEIAINCHKDPRSDSFMIETLVLI